MAKKENPSRDKLRSLTLGRDAKFRKRIVNYFPPILEEVTDENGDVSQELQGYDFDNPIKVEVRQPSVKERNKLVMACKDEKGNFEDMEFVLQAAIMFTYDPESGERLYDATDYPMLSDQPAGDFVDQFGEEAIKLLTLGKPQIDSKSSEKTKTSKESSQ